MKQSITNKLGEINFRKKLAEQKTKGKYYFNNLDNPEIIEKIIIEKIEYAFNKQKNINPQPKIYIRR